MSTKKREYYLDAAKGIGIFLVLLGHANPPEIVFQVIYSFHMPLFFLIAGFLFDKEKWYHAGIWKFVKNRAKKYLVPYAGFCIANTLLSIPLEYQKAVNFDLLAYLIKNTKALLYGGCTVVNSRPLWFFVCLFVAEIWLYLLLKIDQRSIRLLICLLLLCFEKACALHNIYTLPWKLDSACVAIAFLALGYEIKACNILQKLAGLKSQKERVTFYLAGLIISGYIILNNGTPDINHNLMQNTFMSICVGTLLSVMLLTFANARLDKNNLFCIMGRHTIPVIGFNNILNTYVKTYLPKADHWIWLTLMGTLIFVCYAILAENRVNRKKQEN